MVSFVTKGDLRVLVLFHFSFFLLFENLAKCAVIGLPGALVQFLRRTASNITTPGNQSAGFDIRVRHCTNDPT